MIFLTPIIIFELEACQFLTHCLPVHFPSCDCACTSCCPKQMAATCSQVVFIWPKNVFYLSRYSEILYLVTIRIEEGLSWLKSSIVSTLFSFGSAVEFKAAKTNAAVCKFYQQNLHTAEILW